MDTTPTAEFVECIGVMDDIMDSNSHDKVSDDELNDLVEEQLLLNRIKEVQTTRRNLEINRLNEDASDGITKDILVDDDTDSLFDFVDVVNECDDKKRKEDLDKLSKALTVNIVMQSELNKLEIFLVDRLKLNRRKQLEVKDEIRQRSQNDDKIIAEIKTSTSYARFGMPYFKDERKFQCNYNSDYKKMISVGQILSINVEPSKMWRLKEKTLLEKGVKNCLLYESIKTFHSQEEKLKHELRSSTSQERIKEIRQQLANIKVKITNTKLKSLSNLFSKCSPDRQFDWLHISAEIVHSHSALECERMWHLYVKPSINKAKWATKEDDKLLELVDKYNNENWDMIALELKTARTGYQCFVNYQTRLNKNIKHVGKWTNNEDQKLTSLVAKCRVGSYIPWTKIAYYFQSRSVSQIYARWNCSLNPDLKKGKFSRQEDRMIVSFVRRFGEDFSKISKMIGDRTSGQVRERYLRAIPAKYQHTGRWSLDEDKLLLTLVKKFGVKSWSAISKQFVTRSRTQVRQRYAAITNNLEKNPNATIEDFNRGPVASLQPQSLPRVNFKIEKTVNKNSLADLIEKRRVEDAFFKRHDELLMTKIKKGRKKILKRSDIDTKLINYFRETYTNNRLKLKTHYIKPDTEKAINGIALFCQFLQAHINLPSKESYIYKRLPFALRNIVQTMQERSTKWGCYCISRESSHCLNTCLCREENSIDCFPIDLKTTLIDDSDFLLSPLLRLQEQTEQTANPKRCACFFHVNKHRLPYYLPPNLMTSIGFRSTLLIKDKIAMSLSYDRKRCGYFSRDDAELRKNGLKQFTGYFSDDDESIHEEASEIKSKCGNNPSVSTNCSDDVFDAPSSSASKTNDLRTSETNLSCDSDEPLKFDVYADNTESAIRLTSEEATNLWKERLLAVLGWPIVLANQPPNFTYNYDSTEEVEIEEGQDKKDLENEQGTSSCEVSEQALLVDKDLTFTDDCTQNTEGEESNQNQSVKRKYEELKDKLLADTSDTILCDVFRVYRNKNKKAKYEAGSTEDKNSDSTFSSKKSAVIDLWLNS